MPKINRLYILKTKLENILFSSSASSDRRKSTIRRLEIVDEHLKKLILEKTLKKIERDF